MKYWQKNMETMPKSDIEALQLKRLKHIVNTVCKNVPFYKQKFRSSGLHTNDIRSLQDISRIPTTQKADLKNNYPFGLFAVPMRDIIRLHTSSGTSGKPIVVGYTARDIETWSNLMARNLTMVGTDHDDIFQNAVNYGLF